jgi:hypothetical protein
LSRVNFFGTRDVPDAENLDLQKYRETAEILMCKLVPDSPTATTNRTKSMIHFFLVAFLSNHVHLFLLVSSGE